MLTLTPISAQANFVAGVLPPSSVVIGSVLNSDPTATAGKFATVAAATLTPLSTIVNSTAGATPPSTVTVGSFLDSDLTASQTDFTSYINWGDQTTSAGAVTASPGVPGRFDVTGAHVYQAPGTYSVTVTVQDSQGHNVTINSTAVASTAQIFTFTGGLASVPGNGPNTASGFTTTNRPLFSGTAPAFATVELFARPADVDVNNPLGYAIASSSGQWNLTTGPLADGGYTVTAVVTPPGGFPSQPQPIINNGTVVIDTQTPQVIAVRSSGGNQVTVLFSDTTSGMNLTNLNIKTNYTLTGPHLAVLHPTAISVAPSASPGAGEQVILRFPSLRRARSSLWVFSITGTSISSSTGMPSNVGVTDNAGNSLPAFSMGFAGLAIRSAGGQHRKARV